MTLRARSLEEPATGATELVELLDGDFFAAPPSASTGAASISSEWWRATLYEPLRDFLSRPSKTFRGRLAELSFALVDPEGRVPRTVPLLVEALHAGSLIVDDIEDHGVERRGAPALHRRHGVPTALNAGNWLYFWAATLAERIGLSPERELDARRRIDATLLACHYGQALDLGVRVTDVAQHEVAALVRTTTELKTGELFSLAAALGGYAAAATPGQIQALSRFGRELGVGLQMLDDLGSITSVRRCDKGREDLVNARATWVFAWLSARLDAHEYRRILSATEDVAASRRPPEDTLTALRSSLDPEVRAGVRAHLHSAFEALARVFGFSPGLGELYAELNRLEQSYE